MAGIYLHIPFCKQACHYCDFHFSTSLKHKEAVVEALCQELSLRHFELEGTVETIYFGGGTPSLLSGADLERIFEAIYANFRVDDAAEITLEANPDDLDIQKIKLLAGTPINRLSIGVQSFFAEDLKMMNRAHNTAQVESALDGSKKYFSNISIDLIYGLPEMELSRWKANLEKAVEWDIPHLSCYALTVEPRTALKTFIEKGLIPPVDDELAGMHHAFLQEFSKAKGLVNYEFSNYGKEGYFSRNNIAYWTGKPYLGIGPSAHSFDGETRSWNISNNPIYLKNITAGELSLERETLTLTDRYNEYVMTRLRTMWGASLPEVEMLFGKNYRKYLLEQAQKHIEEHLLFLDGEVLRVSQKGKFLTDGLAADLFLLNLGTN
jgi:oxygen-independent coproporphyrinogen-3 oxidase